MISAGSVVKANESMPFPGIVGELSLHLGETGSVLIGQTTCSLPVLLSWTNNPHP